MAAIVVVLFLCVKVGRAIPPLGFAVLLAVYATGWGIFARHFGFDERLVLWIAIGGPVGAFLAMALYGLWKEGQRRP